MPTQASIKFSGLFSSSISSSICSSRLTPSTITSYSLLSCSLLILSSTAYSAGFALIENSASGMGKAYAGAAAVAEDASTVWFNPAGMTYLSENLGGKSQISSALNIVVAGTDFKDKGSAPPASLGSAVIDGKKIVNETIVSPIPALYYMHPINDKLNFGLSINGPFGSKTEYDEDWIGRYQATKTDMKTFNINPSLSWKANDKLSLGAGISAQYIDVKLGKSYDTAAACRKVALQSGSTAILDYCNARYPKAAQYKKDGQALVSGDDISFGFNLGLLYQPSDLTRVGFTYRSQIKHNLEGKATYQNDPNFVPIVAQLESLGINTFTNRGIEAAVDLPESISLSLVHKLSNRLELMGDVTWTGWSSFKELRITEAGTGTEVTNVPEKWKDVTRVSLGANYKYNDKLTLRTGVALDQEPILSPRYRTPRIPGNDRTWLSFGAGYKMNKKLSLDFGYSHLFLDKTAIDNPGESGYSVKGLYDSQVDIVSAQINYTF